MPWRYHISRTLQTRAFCAVDGVAGIARYVQEDLVCWQLHRRPFYKRWTERPRSERKDLEKATFLQSAGQRDPAVREKTWKRRPFYKRWTERSRSERKDLEKATFLQALDREIPQ
ncbi:hypothetical protein RRG08_030832 [Elysia crispata]|uniref:Uncharacterized protein n=1 Tax=Elysia crispata TaxID=231223 RepID=A0AAE1ADA4_9GAST|nr:hypothetical protein RRG08_030832 [Elysia crispata]